MNGRRLVGASGRPSTSPLGGTDEARALSDVAEIVGAVGVIVSLIYLASGPRCKLFTTAK